MDFNEYEMVLVGIGEEFEENERAAKAYEALLKKLEGKNYFVVSLCMDDKIYEAGLKEDRIVSPLGGKRFKQCPDACENKLYDISETKCSICGKELVYNNYLCENYVENSYIPMWEKHKKWLTGTLNKKLLILELGVSLRFPQIVRWPFEKIAFLNEKSSFIRVNEKLPQLGEEVAKKGISIKQNSVDWLIEN